MPPVATRTFTTAALAAMLSKSVGDDVALASVAAAAAKLGLRRQDFTGSEALTLFGVIAEGEGVIAVAARFLRSRLIAQFSREDLEARSRIG